MDFEEKIDAMRMTLELAIHDVEEQRAAIQELRATVTEVKDASAHQYESVQVQMKATENLLRTAERHEQRISGLEGRT